ncbi:MAG: hypothetical protein ACTS6P_00875 [Candidatus Hodgkinia cicadicola]
MKRSSTVLPPLFDFRRSCKAINEKPFGSERRMKRKLSFVN